MSLTELFIRRPVLSIVLSLIMVIIGTVSFSYLPVRQYPAYDRPVVSVQTGYEGASPQIIESLITRPLEAALAGIEGLDFIQSRSQTEGSFIDLHFKVTRGLDDAANDVRDKISRVRAQLPDGAKNPTIRKTESESAPIIYLALSSNTQKVVDLFSYADKNIKSDLESLPGVSEVEISGAADFVLHVWVDSQKMSAFNVTAQDVSSALKRQNIHMPAGRVKGDDREYNVNTAAKLESPEAFGEVVVANHKGYPIKISDIAKIEFSADEARDAAYFNDKPAILMGIKRKSIANPVEISKALEAILPKIRKTLPKDYDIQIAYDKTFFIKQSINEVYKTLYEATLCVLAIILLFLWSGRATLIPLVTIPVSLISVFTLLYILGFSINMLTLLAIVLAIGLVVDDAIVMLENIYRYIEEGLSPMRAAIKGSKEISFAIIAMTLTLAAVYAPISLSQGVVGKLFTEFALTLAGAVIISGLVALTLSPMMCARLLKPHAGITPFDKVYNRIENGYGKSLGWALKHRFIIFFFGGAFSLLGAIVAFDGLKKEMAPREDIGVVFSYGFPPVGATVEYITKQVDQVEEVFREIPEVVNRLAMIGLDKVYTWNILKPWSERKKSSLQIVKEIKEKIELETAPGLASVGVHPGGSFIGGGSSDRINFIIQTSKEASKLGPASAIIKNLAENSGVFSTVWYEVGGDVSEYKVDIDRNKAAALNVDIQSIAETLDIFVSGRKITNFKRNEDQFKVKVGVPMERKMSVEDLREIYVRGQDKKMVPLSSLVVFKQENSPREIMRYNQLKAIKLTCMINPGFTLGDGIDTLTKIADENLPNDITYEFSGTTRDLLDSNSSMILIFGLAIIFIYLIMSAQFESFTDPFIIMFTVPLSLAGAILSLKLTGGTLNVYTQIGLVTLIGLITKHGILIVDFANKLRVQGLSMAEAAHKATLLRLRPILMTTLAMALGALPFLWSVGAGAYSRYQLGWTIFGGMIIGTLFTLYVIPVVYTLFAHKVVKDPNAEIA
ncbi:MAG: multidrug transporter AcrB [Rickettsiales bacterium]|nr:multidrug transporter AcrB [Rickettsiales bacterium]